MKHLLMALGVGRAKTAALGNIRLIGLRLAQSRRAQRTGRPHCPSHPGPLRLIPARPATQGRVGPAMDHRTRPALIPGACLRLRTPFHVKHEDSQPAPHERAGRYLTKPGHSAVSHILNRLLMFSSLMQRGCGTPRCAHAETRRIPRRSGAHARGQWRPAWHHAEERYRWATRRPSCNTPCTTRTSLIHGKSE